VIPDRFVALLYHDVHPGTTFDYGRLGRSATMYHVSERAFRSHLDLIERAGHPCLDDSDVRACLAGGAGGGTRTGAGPGVVFCFDDGWRGAVTCAAPALAERGLAAFFFITTGFLGRQFFAGRNEVRALDPSLFTVGSHGVTHRMLSSLPPDDIVAELSDSRRSLEDLLGRRVSCLSIPGGAVDRRVLETAAAAGYDYIFTSNLGVNPAPSGRCGIARVGVRQSTDPDTLRRWLAGDFTRERARAALLGVPKRLLGARTYSRLRRVLLGEGTGREHFFEP